MYPAGDEEGRNLRTGKTLFAPGYRRDTTTGGGCFVVRNGGRFKGRVVLTRRSTVNGSTMLQRTPLQTYNTRLRCPPAVISQLSHQFLNLLHGPLLDIVLPMYRPPVILLRVHNFVVQP